MREGKDRILVVQLARMGDLLQTIPLLRGLRVQHPHASLCLLVDSQQEKLARRLETVDEVFLLDLAKLADPEGEWQQGLYKRYRALQDWAMSFRAGGFQTVYNLNRSPFTALIAHLLSPTQLVGFGMGAGGQVVTTDLRTSYLLNAVSHRMMSRINLADVFLSLGGGADLRRALNDSALVPLRFSDKRDRDWADRWLAAQGAGDRNLIVAFQPGAGHAARQWPPEFFGRLGRLLAERLGIRILLLGNTKEEPLGRAILQAAGNDRSAGFLNGIGQTDIGQLAALLERCRLLITNDTGTMHLAGFSGTPVLALFVGSAFCFQTGPYGDGHRVIQASIACAPCTEAWAERQCPEWICRSVITPESIFELVKSDLQDERLEELGKGLKEAVLYETGLEDGWAAYRPLAEGKAELSEMVALCYDRLWKRILDRPLVSDPSPFQILNKVSQKVIAGSGEVLSQLGGLSQTFRQIALRLGETQKMMGFQSDRAVSRPLEILGDFLREAKHRTPLIAPLVDLCVVEEEMAESSKQWGKGRHMKTLKALADGARWMADWTETVGAGVTLESVRSGRIQ